MQEDKDGRACGSNGNRVKRKYDCAKRARTRAINQERVERGLPRLPAYMPKKGYGNTRKYCATGEHRGMGQGLRAFKEPLKYMAKKSKHQPDAPVINLENLESDGRNEVFDVDSEFDIENPNSGELIIDYVEYDAPSSPANDVETASIAAAAAKAAADLVMAQLSQIGGIFAEGDPADPADAANEGAVTYV